MVFENIFRGTPTKITLESAPCFYFCPPHLCPDEDIEQKLTISKSGRVTFTSKNTERFPIIYGEGNVQSVAPPYPFAENFSAGRWMIATLQKEVAGELLEAIVKPFRTPFDIDIMVTDCGSWTLTAYNEDDEKFVFEGFLCPDCFPEAKELSYYIRRTLDMPSLYAFDGGSGTEKYIYASVAFDGSKKSYYYTTNDTTIAVGDKVLAPFGKDEIEGEVVEIDNYTELDVPFPLKKTKAIIKKL